MTDYDGRELEAVALFQQDYESPDLKRQQTPGYWNFLEMVFDPDAPDPRIGLRVRCLNDPPGQKPRGGGAVDVGVSSTGRLPSCRLSDIRTLPGAAVRLTHLDGRPIRGALTRPDGSLPVAGLVDVPPGTQLLLTAHAAGKADAQLIRTLPLA